MPTLFIDKIFKSDVIQQKKKMQSLSFFNISNELFTPNRQHVFIGTIGTVQSYDYNIYLLL